MDQENASEPDSAMYLDDIEVEPLTGKPFFNITMCKSYLQTHLVIPTKFIGSLPENVTVPVILSRGHRSWQVKYASHQYSQKKIYCGWKTFVEDNMIKVGDVCLFELMSCDVTLIKFKVQILRGDFPSALLDKQRETQDSPPQVNEIIE